MLKPDYWEGRRLANCPEDNIVYSDDDFVIIIIVMIITIIMMIMMIMIVTIITIIMMIMIVMIIAIIMIIMREPEDPTLGFVRPHSSLDRANQPTALGSDQDVH